jgi:hypothetical protein
VGKLAHCSTVRYAVIQASSKKDHPETLVIVYPDENCLRDLIAAASIVGLGFNSREEAMAKLVGSMPDSRALRQESRPMPMAHKAQQGCNSATKRRLIKNHRISYHILQCAFAAINVFFYSRNLFSVMLRTALGSCF